MTETYSKPRQQAEIAFSHTQSQFLARNHAVEGVDPVVQAREAKTTRLRGARMAKEAHNISKDSDGMITGGR
jgi:hypothetical protein